GELTCRKHSAGNASHANCKKNCVPSGGRNEPCRRQWRPGRHQTVYERTAYIICEVDLRRHTVRPYWNQPDGSPYAYLSALPRDLEGGAGRLLFATNAGMFDSKLKPVGLYVQQGRELVHANTKSAKGNFHMKPNGILYISDGNAAVAET